MIHLAKHTFAFLKPQSINFAQNALPSLNYFTQRTFKTEARERRWSIKDIKPRLHAADLLSPALAINEKCKRLKQEGVDVINVAFGESPFPCPDLVVEALRANAHHNEYLPVQGIPELREAAASYMNKRFETTFTADQIIVAPGAKMLIQHFMQALDADVLVPSPCWVTYRPTSIITQTACRLVPTVVEENWKLTPDRLLRAIDEDTFAGNKPNCRALVMNYPHNPTGVTYTMQELQALASVCREYRIIVLSDEIYGSLTHTGRDHVSMGHRDVYPEGTFVLNGMSKGFGAGGWRLAFGCIPEELDFLMPIMKVLASNSYSMVCAPVQYAAAIAYQGHPDLDHYESTVRHILSTLGDYVYSLLMQSPYIEAVKPQGGYYIYTDLVILREALARHNLKTGREVYNRLLDEAKVAILPGKVFEQTDQYLCGRFCFVDFDGKAALENYPANGKIDEAWMRKYCANPIVAAERMVNWCNHIACEGPIPREMDPSISLKA